MNRNALSAFYRLPYPLRCAAATIHGLALKTWRYSRETDRLVDEALERDEWGPRRWLDWQQERLAYVLNHAARSVPYYRRHWASRRRAGDRRSWDYVEHWPLLEKSELRQNPRGFLSDSAANLPRCLEQTSGTTGTPLKLWRTRRALVAQYALYDARRLRWHGLSRHASWANAGGQLVAPAARQTAPFWVWNAALRQLYISSYHLSPLLARQALDALRTYSVRHLFGYTSSLEALASAALDQCIDPSKMFPDLRLVTTNAEPIDWVQRAKIQNAFGVPVRETYGMVELVAAASECPHGGLHTWPEMGWSETLPDPLESNIPGRAGELIATSLLDLDMPLVRYRTGDRVVQSGAPHSCPCGRRLPLLSAIEGRRDDVLWTLDGRSVGRLDPVFKADLPIRQAQIVQESLSRFRVRCVPDQGFGPRARRDISDRLKDRLGPVEVIVETVSMIPRGPNGKVRAVESKLSSEEQFELQSRMAIAV